QMVFRSYFQAGTLIASGKPASHHDGVGSGPVVTASGRKPDESSAGIEAQRGSVIVCYLQHQGLCAAAGSNPDNGIQQATSETSSLISRGDGDPVQVRRVAGHPH